MGLAEDLSYIESLFQPSFALIKYLEEKREISFKSYSEDHFKKNLTVVAASYLEHRLGSILTEIIKQKCSDPKFQYFAINKGLERQFQTFFDFKTTNVNKFLALFGEEFKSMICKEIDADKELTEQMTAFMEILRIRNDLVHNNYIIFPASATLTEIYEKTKNGIIFLDYIGQKLAA